MTMVLRAPTMTLFIYVVELVFALVPAGMVANAVEGLVGAHPSSARGLLQNGGPLALETAFHLARYRTTIGFTGLGIAVAMLILHPWLLMSWLHALRSAHQPRASIIESLARGALQYGKAVAVSLLWLAFLATGFGLVAGFGWAVEQASTAAPNAQQHDVVRGCLAIAAVVWITLWGTGRDLAYASLSSGQCSPWQACTRAWSRLSAGAALEYGGWLFAGLMLAGAAHVVIAAMVNRDGLSAGLIFVGAQLLMFGRSAIRAHWLDRAIARTDSPQHVAGPYQTR